MRSSPDELNSRPNQGLYDKIGSEHDPRISTDRKLQTHGSNLPLQQDQTILQSNGEKIKKHMLRLRVKILKKLLPGKQRTIDNSTLNETKTETSREFGNKGGSGIPSLVLV